LFLDCIVTGVVLQMPPRGHYLAHEVGRLAGVSGITIGQWARRGYIRSSQSSGRPRVYSYQDVAEAMVVHELLERGILHRRIKVTIELLRNSYGNAWPLTHAKLGTAGGQVVAEEAGELRYEVSDHEWQQLHADDLVKIANDLHRGGWAARRLPDLSHIEVNPNRLSGRPVIRGTRVPVEVVVELASKPGGRAQLRDGYEIGGAAVDEAIAWWAAAQEFETAA
jgi:uncharacterized protein (DUF433 family)/DNA-binding transcriptional MerR regulator